MTSRPIILDMTPDGQFRQPPGRAATPFSAKVLRVAILVGVLTGALALAALAIASLFILIPIAAGAGVVAWATYRWRRWRMTRAVAPPRA
jgi:hypothetical protein